MLKSLLVSFSFLTAQLSNPDANFLQLKNQLESYGFQVNMAIPPDFNLPNLQPDFHRKRVRKPYGVLNSSSKSIWINPIVLDLGIANSVLIHETVHAAQFCAGNGNIKALGLDIEPIKQAQPFFKRYIDTHSQEIEKEAYAVQTQSNSFKLAMSLLNHHCD